MMVTGVAWALSMSLPRVQQVIAVEVEDDLASYPFLPVRNERWNLQYASSSPAKRESCKQVTDAEA